MSYCKEEFCRSTGSYFSFFWNGQNIWPSLLVEKLSLPPSISLSRRATFSLDPYTLDASMKWVFSFIWKLRHAYTLYNYCGIVRLGDSIKTISTFFSCCFMLKKSKNQKKSLKPIKIILWSTFGLAWITLRLKLDFLTKNNGKKHTVSNHSDFRVTWKYV